MQCPDCGYMMTAFDAECVRCASYKKRGLPPPALLKKPECIDPEPVIDPSPVSETAAPCPPAPLSPGELVAKACPNCGAHVPLEAAYCPACGTGMRDQSGPTLAVAFMWFFTLMGWVGGAAGGWGVAILFDVPAIIIAFVILGTSNEANRKHAKIKMWLELVAFVIGFIIGFAASQRQF